MELTEDIVELNKRLREHFGIDTVSSSQMWRIVWSDDQIEKRLTSYTKEGFELLTPMMVELPKYSWIRQKYVLEQLVIVPVNHLDELTTKVSYEPIWVFQDDEGNYLPPKWEMTEFVIYAIYAVRGKPNLAKYKEKLTDLNSREGIEARVNELEAQLFGNETSTGDALAHGDAIVVPQNYEKVKH